MNRMASGAHGLPTRKTKWPLLSDIGESADFQAKPFLKWAGGKSQLLPQMRCYYPAELGNGAIYRYIEPFLGGGAAYLDIAQRFDIEESHLFDINEELILTYRVVQHDPGALIEQLTAHRQHYVALSETARSAYFYCVRERYNAQKSSVDFQTYSSAWVERAADMIFLNKTCFNGLFRVNASGLFNVPFGHYRNPVIFEEENLLYISQLLQNATLHAGSFEACAFLVDKHSFVYFDPPYRPISPTASFTSYSRAKFDDNEQRRLAQFYGHLAAESGAKLMLSNSDPKNLDAKDNFFDDLYAPFTVRRVKAKRMINSVGDERGPINEILVTNY